MSTPQNDGPAVPAEKKKGFDKYVERFKRAMGKSSSSSQKRLSLSAAAKPTPATGRLVPLSLFTLLFTCLVINRVAVLQLVHRSKRRQLQRQSQRQVSMPQ